MDHDIAYYHKELQKWIHVVEKDESNADALKATKDAFIIVFNMIKMIMIAKQERYYGCFLMNFDLRIDFTAYYDAGVSIDVFPFQMIINPLLLGLKSLSEMVYIICHEIEHIVLNHPADGVKYNPNKDPAVGLKLNIAMDTSINDRLSTDSKTNQFHVISEPDGAFTSEFLREEYKLHIKALQAFDYYFERVPDRADMVADGKVLIISSNLNREKEIITESKRKGTICLHSWTTSADPDEISSIIRKFIGDAYNGMTEKQRGELPAHQKEALKGLLSPPVVSWKQLLKKYIGTIPDGHRKTKMRLNRRQPLRYDISGVMNDRIIKLIVAIDTSGSMSIETLDRVFVEIFGIIGTRLCEVTIIECDAEIQSIYKAHSIEDISYKIKGRGGTSFIPVIEYINANRQLRDAILIYFTDGMGNHSIPRPLVFRIMWVLPNDNCKLSVRNPYGEILVID